ncbi:MAG: hypothetical protein QOE62_4156 [Actinomycetota bacterium]|nr:hypothetical protein [Actinomycetota bacterium]
MPDRARAPGGHRAGRRRDPSLPCGPDPEKHIEAINTYRDAGNDEVYITQVNPDQDGFLRFYEREILLVFRTQLTGSRTA